MWHNQYVMNNHLRMKSIDSFRRDMLNSCLIRAHHTLNHNKHGPHTDPVISKPNPPHLSLRPYQARTGTGGSARRPTTVPGAVLAPRPVPLGPTPTYGVRPAAPAARLVISVPRRRGTSPPSRAPRGTTALTVTPPPSPTTGLCKASESCCF